MLEWEEHFEYSTIPFFLLPMKIKFSYLEKGFMTEEVVTSFIILMEDMLNQFVYEDILDDRDIAKRKSLPYSNLTISLANAHVTQTTHKNSLRDEVQIYLKENVTIHNDHINSVILHFQNAIYFRFATPAKLKYKYSYTDAVGKVYEFPSLPTLKNIENQVEFMFQNKSQLEIMRQELVLIFPDELNRLEEIYFDGYDSSFATSLNEMTHSRGRLHAPISLVTKNILFIFVGVLVVGCTMFFMLLIYRRHNSKKDGRYIEMYRWT